MSMSGRTRRVLLAFLGSMLALPLVVHSQPQRQPVDTAGHVAVAVFTNVTGEQAAISHGRNNSASFSDGFIQPRVCRAGH